MAASIPFVVLCVVFASQASAQFLAGQEVDVSTYTNELYYESAGSYQRILYEDGVNSTTTTNLIWSEVYVAPCGEITAHLCTCSSDHLQAVSSAVLQNSNVYCIRFAYVQGFGCPCCMIT